MEGGTHMCGRCGSQERSRGERGHSWGMPKNACTQRASPSVGPWTLVHACMFSHVCVPGRTRVHVSLDLRGTRSGLGPVHAERNQMSSAFGLS